MPLSYVDDLSSYTSNWQKVWNTPDGFLRIKKQFQSKIILSVKLGLSSFVNLNLSMNSVLTICAMSFNVFQLICHHATKRTKICHSNMWLCELYLDNNTQIKFLKFCLSISKLFPKLALTKDLCKTLKIRLRLDQAWLSVSNEKCNKS